MLLYVGLMIYFDSLFLLHLSSIGESVLIFRNFSESFPVGTMHFFCKTTAKRSFCFARAFSGMSTEELSSEFSGNKTSDDDLIKCKMKNFERQTHVTSFVIILVNGYIFFSSCFRFIFRKKGSKLYVCHKKLMHFCRM